MIKNKYVQIESEFLKNLFTNFAKILYYSIRWTTVGTYKQLSIVVVSYIRIIPVPLLLLRTYKNYVNFSKNVHRSIILKFNC